MFSVWMKAFGDGEPLKPHPANADDQTATNAANMVDPTILRQYMDRSIDFRYAGPSQ
ncbi:MAG: hypothetical protein N838_12065 [Thiohalocapsa sp. PB-PSB1]|jgi:hypothetical protein|nr:MAG: hypothetical protein N838_12065 [Thiohalocapsa sp. PB-PSB1]